MSTSTAPARRRWLGLALIAAAQFVVIMDTSIIGVALPDMQAELGFTPEIAVLGVQRLRRRIRRSPAARRPPLRPARSSQAYSSPDGSILASDSVLAGPRATSASRSPDVPFRARAPRSSPPQHSRLLMALFGGTDRAAAGVRGLRRRRSDRRHRRRLPRRRAHRVRQLAVGVLRRPCRSPSLVIVSDAARCCPGSPASAAGRHRRRDHRHRRPRRPRLRRRARPRGRLGIDRDARRPRRRRRSCWLVFFIDPGAAAAQPLLRLGIFRAPQLGAANIAQLLLGAAWVPMWFFLNLYLQQVLGAARSLAAPRSCR